MKQAVADGTDTDIKWDDDNCVSSFGARGNKAFADIQEQFRHMVFTGRATFTAQLGRELESSQRDPLQVVVFKDAASVSYATGAFGACGGGRDNYTLGQLFAHEIIHHGPVALGRPMTSSERSAIVRGDNAYNAQRDKQPRCRHAY